MMRLPRRDMIATVAVGAAVALYLMWVADATLPGMSGIRITSVAILALGFVASAVAVVPGFDQLMRGNKGYLMTTSVLGLVALVAGVVTLWSTISTALGLLMATLVALWLIATAHHALLARSAHAVPRHEAAPSVMEDRHHAGVR